MSEFCKHDIHESHYCGSCHHEFMMEQKDQINSLKKKVELLNIQRNVLLLQRNESIRNYSDELPQPLGDEYFNKMTKLYNKQLEKIK